MKKSSYLLEKQRHKWKEIFVLPLLKTLLRKSNVLSGNFCCRCCRLCFQLYSLHHSCGLVCHHFVVILSFATTHESNWICLMNSVFPMNRTRCRTPDTHTHARAHKHMQVLYTRIAVALWKSSQGIEHHIAMMNRSSCNSNAANSVNSTSHRSANTKYDKRTTGIAESQVKQK